MKKILSLTLAALMLVSMIPTAMAADYTEGTQITLNGSGTESYTVTVPATMSPGDTGTVKAEGTWGTTKVLSVTHPSSVELRYGAQSGWVDITSGAFIIPGNDTVAVTHEEEITVKKAVYDENDEVIKVLFGTWTGILNYDVELVETAMPKGDANNDGIINQADIDYIQKVIVNTIQLNEEEMAAVVARADMNDDGEISADDSARLIQVLSGKISIT